MKPVIYQLRDPIRADCYRDSCMNCDNEVFEHIGSWMYLALYITWPIQQQILSDYDKEEQ